MLRQLILSHRHLKIMENNLEAICNANNLYQSFREAKKDVGWKESVQRYELDLLANICKTQQAIRNGTYRIKPMTEFKLHERGRVRLIKAQHISDRVVQRSLNDNMLLPRIRPRLIYDNGASLTGKGADFARKRFRVHLQKAYKDYGEEAVILYIDFSKYFDNIRHDEALRQLKPYLSEREFEFAQKCFKDFEVDVSYMSDEEYSNCMDVLFNALEYEKPSDSIVVKKFMRKSVGIGNQLSQVVGILYPSEIDGFCKTVLGLKYYGRYMDDTYIILPNKKEARRIHALLLELYRSKGIFVNEKKTRFNKITGWQCFLKVNYKILPSCRVIRKVHNSTMMRMRRRLRKYKKLCDTGKMTVEHITQCYKGWRGTYRKYDSGYKLHRLDKYFEKLFLVRI